MRTNRFLNQHRFAPGSLKRTHQPYVARASLLRSSSTVASARGITPIINVVEVIPPKKTDKIRAAWAAGDCIGALRIAAKFFDRSEATKSFKRGMDAYNNPNFYRQLGKDPDLLVTLAVKLVQKRFRLYPHRCCKCGLVPRRDPCSAPQSYVSFHRLRTFSRMRLGPRCATSGREQVQQSE